MDGNARLLLKLFFDVAREYLGRIWESSGTVRKKSAVIFIFRLGTIVNAIYNILPLLSD